MRAAQLVARSRFDVGRFPVPPLEPGDVLVRTRLAAICGSDVKLVYGAIGPDEFPCPAGWPGHEGIGEVLESRSPEHRAGDLVLTTPRPGASRAFADRQVVPGTQVVQVPPTSDLAAMLMAQQLGTVIYALKHFWSGPPGETAAVIGAGAAGLHFTQLLKRAGFGRVVVGDLHPHRLEAARALGADATVLARGESLVEATLDLTGGRGADLVVEAVGLDTTRAQAVRAVAFGGRIGLFGLPEHRGDMAFPFAEAFHRRPSIEISVGTQDEPGLVSFREAVRRIHSGEVDVSRLVTHRFALERLQDAFALASEPDGRSIKVAITFDETRSGAN